MLIDPQTPLLWMFGFWLQTDSLTPLAPTTPLFSKIFAEGEAGAQSLTPGGLSLPIWALGGVSYQSATRTVGFSPPRPFPNPLCPPGCERGSLPLPGPAWHAPSRLVGAGIRSGPWRVHAASRLPGHLP